MLAGFALKAHWHTWPHRGERRTGFNVTQLVMMESWLLGYVSGFDDHGWTDTPEITPDMNNGSVIAWVDTYCRNNPMANLNGASSELVREIIARAQAQ